MGGYNPGRSPSLVLTSPYAEHWSGTAWTATRVPLSAVYPSPRQAAQLEGAVAIGSADAWAVGHVDDLWTVASRNLAYHWNGTIWSRMTTPKPGGAHLGNHLLAVAARSTADVWAVGDSGYPASSLVLQWNGTAWSQTTVPTSALFGPLLLIKATCGLRAWAAWNSSTELDGHSFRSRR